MYREALHHFGVIHDQEMDMDYKAEVEKILEVDLAHRENLDTWVLWSENFQIVVNVKYFHRKTTV